MVKHNNILPDVHLRKDWKSNVKTWFDQPARKQKRRVARQAKAAAAFPASGNFTSNKLRPVVRALTKKYNTKLRYGRGFTHEELAKVGLTPAFARTVGIAVDHRRQNLSKESLEMNVRRLEDYKKKLVLFPRKAGNPKKGEIADSTQEQVEKAVQNANKNVVTKPNVVKRQRRAAITEEQKNERVYHTLRKARTDEQHLGQREKRAREAAEEEK